MEVIYSLPSDISTQNINPSASIVASRTVIDLFLLHIVQDHLNILVPFDVINP